MNWIAAFSLYLGFKKPAAIVTRPKENPPTYQQDKKSNAPVYVSLKDETLPNARHISRTSSFSMDETMIDGVKRIEARASGYNSDESDSDDE